MSDDFDQDDSGPSRERWLVSFADFITLMFAVFAVLYATSTQDLEKTKEFEESVKRFLVKAGAFGGTGDKVNQGEKHTNPIEPPIQTFTNANPLSKETYDEAEKYLDEELGEAERDKYVKDVSLDELGVRMILSGSELYAADSVKFQESALPFLEKLGGFLSRIGRRVMIEGHYSKEKSPSVAFPSSWEFSGARATAMARYLIKRHKMDEALFVPISFGASRPLTEAKDNKRPNERVELVILTEDLPF